MTHSECRNLFEASKSLLVKSGLVHYCGHSFVCKNPENELEDYWKKNFDCEFGRYMAWVWFSVGAENLVKAALVCHGLKVKPKKLGYPEYSHNTDTESWVAKVLNPEKNAHGSEEAQKYDAGTLDKIWRSKLDGLSEKGIVPDSQRDELKAAYRYLTEAIRNRDAHTYIQNQRRKDFPAVKGVFVSAFNTLVQTMKDNGHFEAVGDD